MTPEEEAIEAATLAASIDEATRLAYVRLLATHDWRFQWAEGEAYRRGMDQRRRLREMQAAIDPKGIIWDLLAPRDYRRAVEGANA